MGGQLGGVDDRRYRHLDHLGVRLALARTEALTRG
jgi:hypothetical protein